jgi:alpha-beta hydrolase superfamily lysophospholipase
MNNLVVGHAMSAISSSDAIEWLTTSDGHRIPLRHWPVENARAVVHIAHGMAEHSGCYADVAALLNAEGLAVMAHDHRCHGLAVSNGALGNTSMLQHWSGVCSDMTVVNAEVRRRYPELPLILLGHSMGSFVSQHFAQRHPERINLLLLEGSSYQAPWFTRMAGLMCRFEGWRQGDHGRSPLIHALSFGGFNKAFKNARTDFDWLSRDEDFVDRYIADPLCGYQLCNGYWREFIKGLSAIYQPEAMRGIRTDLPVYLFAGSRDPAGHNGRGVVRLANLYREVVGSRDVTLRLYPGARHDILHETNRDEVLTDLLGWLRRHLP